MQGGCLLRLNQGNVLFPDLFSSRKMAGRTAFPEMSLWHWEEAGTTGCLRAQVRDDVAWAEEPESETYWQQEPHRDTC